MGFQRYPTKCNINIHPREDVPVVYEWNLRANENVCLAAYHVATLTCMRSWITTVVRHISEVL